MKNVCKRDGTIVPFDETKIEAAMQKAFAASGEAISDYRMRLLMLNALSKIDDAKVDPIGIEQIQDIVESVLGEAGFGETMRVYSAYRAEHTRQRKGLSDELSTKKTMEKYLNQSDWRVKENSTVNFSLGGLILGNSGALTANYWLNHIYPKEIGEAHHNCDMHIHDLSMYAAYCAGWNLKQLIQEGIKSVGGRIGSAPAKHLHTLANQMVNFLGIMQNEWAGQNVGPDRVNA